MQIVFSIDCGPWRSEIDISVSAVKAEYYHNEVVKAAEPHAQFSCIPGFLRQGARGPEAPQQIIKNTFPSNVIHFVPVPKFIHLLYIC